MEREPRRAVSAVVVAYRSEADLRVLLPPLRSAVSEVVVVDNASPDASARVAADLLPDGTVVRRDRNDGFAAGVNAGVEASTGDLVLLVNPDVRLGPDAVTRLVEAAERHPGDVVGPRVERSDGRVQPTRKGVPSLWTLLGEEVLLPESSPVGRLPARLWPRWQDYDREVEAPLLSAVCLLVPRATLRAVGPFDERFFLYWEEVDWQLRARRLGIRTWLVPAARVTHHRSSSAGELSPAKARMLATSTRFFLHRWLPPGRRVVASAILAGGQAARAVAWSSPPWRGRPDAARRRQVHGQAARILVRPLTSREGREDRRRTLWLVDPYGRGGIARYAVDVANLLDTRWRPVVATTSAGPAPGLRGEPATWFPYRTANAAGKLQAAVTGVAHAVGSSRRGDVAWIPLGIRPLYELILASALRARGVRVLATVHNRRPHHHGRPSPVVRRTGARCQGVVVHTRAVAEWATAVGMKVVRLPFPVPDLGHCAPAGRHDRRSLAAPEELLVLLFGNLFPYKGVDVLLEAFAQARDDDPSLPLRLVLAGQVPRGYDPAAEADRLGVAAHVDVLAGYVPDGELLDLLAAADAVALPYRHIDHSGAGALAAARGLPAVASDLPCLREVFGDAALYVRPGDRTQLASALSLLPRALPALQGAAARRAPATPIGDEYVRVLAPLIDGRGRA